MFYKIIYLFLLFFIYSIIGYIFEVALVTFCEKKFTPSRGFLIGPYIPIYGIGIICMVKLLAKYQNDFLVLFVMSTVVCTILEYLTSLLMEKLFKLRWWDYSHMSFNLNGRVCLLNSILFGIGGVVITKFVNPIIEGLLTKIPHLLIIILGLIFLLIFIADLTISLIAMFNIKIEVRKYTKKDATDAIKREIAEFLKDHTFLRNQIDRIITAFPNAKSRKEFNLPDYKELITKIKQEVAEAKQELKEKLTKQK